MSACFCIGAQNGQPVCPCKMRNVVIRNGRYIYEEDLGAAPTAPITNILEQRRNEQLRPWYTAPDEGDFK